MQFEALYREHYARIWRAMQRLGVAERDAADAAQEVFMIAYKRWADFEGRSTPRTWLFGIAIRVAAGRRRLASTSRELLATEAAEPVPDPAPDPEVSLVQGDLRHLLQAGLDALPFEQRVVFTMFEIEGFSGEEIAAALELPEGTVRSRLRLARAAFSRCVRSEFQRTEPGSATAPSLEATHERS